MTIRHQTWTDMDADAVTTLTSTTRDSVDNVTRPPLGTFVVNNPGQTSPNLDNDAVNTVTALSTASVDSITGAPWGPSSGFSADKYPIRPTRRSIREHVVDAVTTPRHALTVSPAPKDVVQGTHHLPTNHIGAGGTPNSPSHISTHGPLLTASTTSPVHLWGPWRSYGTTSDDPKKETSVNLEELDTPMSDDEVLKLWADTIDACQFETTPLNRHELAVIVRYGRQVAGVQDVSDSINPDMFRNWAAEHGAASARGILVNGDFNNLGIWAEHIADLRSTMPTNADGQYSPAAAWFIGNELTRWHNTRNQVNAAALGWLLGPAEPGAYQYDSAPACDGHIYANGHFWAAA